MKKGLIIMCAALFVAAMVLPALAVDMSISGYYRVRGFYQSNADQGTITPWKTSGPSTLSSTTTTYGNPTSGGEAGHTHPATTTTTGRSINSPDAWWDHMLQLDPVFKVADNLKLVTRVSMFNNQIWGSNTTSGGVNSTGALNAASFGDDADNVVFNNAYIDWTTAKGRVKIGRMPGNFTFFTPWANTTLDADRIMYFSPTWGPFSFYAFHEKRQENSVTSGHNMADEDENRYAILFQYTTPTVYAGYALDYYRDRSGSGVTTDPNGIWSANYYKHSFCLKATDPSNTFFFEGELQLQTGDYRDYYLASATDIDRKGWGWYASAGMKKGPLTVGIGGAFTSGDDNAASTDNEYKVGPASGLDFQPLYILYGPMSNILNTTLTNPATKAGYSNGTAYDAPGTTATGSMAGWIYGDFTVNPQLALHGALGYAKADKVTTIYQSDKLGSELDLGLKYQIMSNLAYELHFGYLWTGDLYKGTTSQNYNTDNVYQLDHSLTLSF